MAITSQSHTGDGTTRLYAITFPYLSTSDVNATLDGTATTDFSVTASNQVEFTTAPGNGVAIQISRVTDDSESKLVFSTGSSIKAADLNNAFKQSLYLNQEGGPVAIAPSGFGDSSNRPIACFGNNSTPSGGGSSNIKFPNSNAPTIKGDGLIKANNGIEVTGNVDATGNLNGTLGDSQVRDAIALGNKGNKGTYAFCTLVNNTADRAAGYEAAGSDLRFSNANASSNGTPNGTWRLMGRLVGQSGDGNQNETSLWLRIS